MGTGHHQSAGKHRDEKRFMERVIGEVPILKDKRFLRKSS